MPDLDEEIKEEEEYEKDDADYLDEQKYADEYEDRAGENVGSTGETPGLTERVYACVKCGKKKIVKEDEMKDALGPPVHCGMVMQERGSLEEEVEFPYKKGKKKTKPATRSRKARPRKRK